MTVVGWDIGGANLKQATAEGRAWSVPFELWRRPDDLSGELRRLLTMVDGEIDGVAVTMTGELADCFATKAEGVDRILSAVEIAAADIPVAVWTTAGEFVTPARARRAPLAVAASNWQALATWAGRLTPQSSAVLIDIGSTTTDIIPLSSGRPCSQGLTDVTRLQAGELVYTGVRRTPLCALSQTVRWRGRETPVAAELFATTLDAYLLLGDIAPDETDCHTANGKPATVAAAHDRIARMVCCDRDELPLKDAVEFSRQWRDMQERLIADRLRGVAARLPRGEQPGCSEAAELLENVSVVLSGSGEFLARRVLAVVFKREGAVRVSLTERLGPGVAEGACAYAVAVLLRERRTPEVCG
jgi:probable H4MPT-linked C1 transfer pathway protein